MLARRLETLILLASAAFAVAFALVTRMPTHSSWASCAAVGYLLAALCWNYLPRAAAWLLVTGTVLVPLAVQLANGLAVGEVNILREAAEHWLATGTPYQIPSDAANPDAYTVYLPGLVLLGMPSAVFGRGWATDPRLFQCAITLIGFLILGRSLPRPGAEQQRGGSQLRIAVLMTCNPFMALQLVTGATDPIVLATLCAGFALAHRRHDRTSALLFGFSACLKQFAWPALLLSVLLTLYRQPRQPVPSRIVRGLSHMAVLALPIIILMVIPMIVDPWAFWLNTVRFPLGLEAARLTAESPLPGYLLARSGFGWLSVALLAIAAIAMLLALLKHPPRSAGAAATWLAAGLAATALLGPSARFGYFAYPVVLLAFARFALQSRPLLSNSGNRANASEVESAA